MIEYLIFLSRLVQLWGHDRNEIWHKGSLGEKACDTALDDEKYNWPHTAVRLDRTCLVVTALCNKPEAFASDLSDDQSHYLFLKTKMMLRERR